VFFLGVKRGDTVHTAVANDDNGNATGRGNGDDHDLLAQPVTLADAACEI